MKEKIFDIYLNKADEYNYVLNLFDKIGVKYILLNFLFPDDNPGDLDIMVNKDQIKTIESTLMQSGFIFYTEFNSNQFLWNKYVENVGFIQFHLYLGLSFMNHTFFKKIPEMKKKDDEIDFQFFVFLIESYFRNSYKKSIFESYIKLTSFARLNKFVEKYNPKFKSLINSVFEFYENGKSTDFKAEIKLGFSSYPRLFQFYVKKILSKLNRIGNTQDKLILILGVDGAGKSTLINGVVKVLVKGGIYPKQFYFGLRRSIFYKMFNSKKNSPTTKSKKEISKKKKLGLKSFVKVLAYWLEYNLLLFVKTKLMVNSARTVYLLDRSYLDLLYYHPSSLVKMLFINYSLKPKKIILLTGDVDVIYDRTREVSKEILEKQNTFYLGVIEEFQTLKRHAEILSTTDLDEELCKFKSVNFIMENNTK